MQKWKINRNAQKVHCNCFLPPFYHLKQTNPKCKTTTTRKKERKKRNQFKHIFKFTIWIHLNNSNRNFFIFIHHFKLSYPMDAYYRSHRKSKHRAPQNLWLIFFVHDFGSNGDGRGKVTRSTFGENVFFFCPSTPHPWRCRGRKRQWQR